MAMNFSMGLSVYDKYFELKNETSQLSFFFKQDAYETEKNTLTRKY